MILGGCHAPMPCSQRHVVSAELQARVGSEVGAGGGLAGSFFRPLAASYILAILASLLVALTVTPALSLLLLPASALRSHRDSPVTSLAKSIYRRVLPLLLRRTNAIIVGLLLMFLGAAIAILRLGEELMPKFKETDFLMHWVEKPGIGIEAMDRITTGLALLPLLLTGDKPGQEIEYPMAFLILGGLTSSTLLNLFVLPSLCLRFGERAFPKG